MNKFPFFPEIALYKLSNTSIYPIETAMSVFNPPAVEKISLLFHFIPPSLVYNKIWLYSATSTI